MILQFRARPGILDLGWGHPAEDALPGQAWAEATAETMRVYGWQALTYGHEAGPGPLIDWLGEPAANTFITAGASHALDLIARLLTSPGDVAIVDSPTYHLAMRIFAGHSLDLVGAPTDPQGIDPAALTRLVADLRAAGRRVGLLYLVPTFGNPTGLCLTTSRRADLLRAAREAGLTVVEDDTYRELWFGEAPPPSMWSLAEAGEAIRVGSFAKSVAPGLRLGWINAEAAFVRRLVDLGYVDSGGGVNHAAALTMATFAGSGAYGRHLGVIRALYAARRDMLVRALRKACPDLTVPNPAGGWFVWLPLPSGVSARALLPVAEEHGTSFMDGSRFFADGRGDGYVRLSFSMLPDPELEEAAARFAAALRAVD
jgi:2-aminoadipate transaminase